MNKAAAIILAAGKGTRMKSSRPKVIFELSGKPLLNWVLDTALAARCDPIAVVVGYKKELVIKAARKENEIFFVEQSEQLGTGHAVMSARQVLKNFSGDIFVLCGDVPLLKIETLQKLQAEKNKFQAGCVVLTAILEDPQKYGRIVRDDQNNVERIVEYKDADESVRQIREINTGIYCFDAQALFDSLEKITNKNKQQEYYLTDTLEIMLQNGIKVRSLILADNLEATGINSREDLANLENEYLSRIEG
ncbi:MAG: NTP transferase domain-containing protein [Candidatus Cloacimonetes bacterium]|nr:NTP transferase domain-containing protein [Candidatus Cloacimonadota bacterium]